MSNIQWKRSRTIVTPDDRSPVVGISAIICVLFAFTALIARIFTKLKVMRKMTPDDYTIVLAWVLSVVQSSLMVVAAHNGLGRRLPVVTPSQQRLVNKTSYAADLLFITIMSLAKISVAIFVANIAPFAPHKRISRAYIAIVALWGIASMFTAGFLCKLAVLALLQSDGSFQDALKFWNSFGVLNLLFEVFLIAWPSWTFLSLQARLKERLIVVIWFSTRIATVAAVAMQLVYLNSLSSQTEPAFNEWRLAVCTQCVQSLSIVTTCTTCMRPLLNIVNSGLIRSDILHRSENGSYFSHGSVGYARKASRQPTSLLSRSRRNKQDGILRTNSFTVSSGNTEPQETISMETMRRTSSQVRILPENAGRDEATTV